MCFNKHNYSLGSFVPQVYNSLVGLASSPHKNTKSHKQEIKFIKSIQQLHMKISSLDINSWLLSSTSIHESSITPIVAPFSWDSSLQEHSVETISFVLFSSKRSL